MVSAFQSNGASVQIVQVNSANFRAIDVRALSLRARR